MGYPFAEAAFRAPSRTMVRWARWQHHAGAVLLWAVLAAQGSLVALRVHGPRDVHWPATGHPLVDVWGHWDSAWYAHIAQDGYSYTFGGASAWAFFPAYPALMRGVCAVTGVRPGVAGFALSLVFGLTAVLLLTEFATLWLPRRRALLAAAGLALYPYSVFLRGPLYTDGMALTTTVGAFLALERRRPALSCLLALLAACTRFEVVPLAVALAWRGWEMRRDPDVAGRARRFARAFAPAVFAVAGQGVVSAYSWYRVGDPLAFLHAQSYVGWQGDSVAARLLKTRYLHHVAGLLDGNAREGWRVGLETAGLLCVVAACCLVPMVARRMSYAYAAFVVLTVAVIVTGTAGFQSSGRYLLACFPCVVVLAARVRRGGWMTVTVVVALLAQAVLALGFSEAVLVG